MAEYKLRFYKEDEGEPVARGLIVFKNSDPSNKGNNCSGEFTVIDLNDPEKDESTNVDGTWWTAGSEGHPEAMPYFVTLAGGDPDVRGAYLSLLVSSINTGRARKNIAGQAKFNAPALGVSGSFLVVGTKL